MFTKRGLVILSGLLWSVAGFNVFRKGLAALILDHRWWCVLLAFSIGVGFLMMFKGVVRKYTLRIAELEGERFPFYRFMSVKGYVLIGVMMTLGITMGLIPGMPTSFFASFYTGLGTALSYGAIRFIYNSFRG